MSMYDKLLTREILRASARHPDAYKWSIQGLGMLRLYLSDEVRMHVWNKHFIIPSVSPLHTHPWAFDSYVVAGVVKQTRYVAADPRGILSEPYRRARITCGANAKAEEPDTCYLCSCPEETFKEGESYRQWQDEIHWSYPEDGTVTIVTRHFQKDREHAFVFWKEGAFVSAEPRTATPEEVTAFCTIALARYF